mmetsp:Transcript_7751/g.20295  ORF Transcript_7751/g.20295 Transcript_7751/m.20295 type:complete len:130 (-) Transcript_7751:4386-4775(-)
MPTVHSPTMASASPPRLAKLRASMHPPQTQNYGKLLGHTRYIPRGAKPTGRVHQVAKQNYSGRRGKPAKCFSCGSTAHLAASCPTRQRRVYFAEDEKANIEAFLADVDDLRETFESFLADYADEFDDNH